MASQIPTSLIMQLRGQGLSDNLISEELRNEGYNDAQIAMALAQVESSFGENSAVSGMPNMPSSVGYNSPKGENSTTDVDNLYERIEEIAENMIDEKWDELIGEVKKIVEWKNKVETQINQLNSDVGKLKEDFTLLHQGVLGKLEDYDTRMRDVGTELNAVGKVFKDVIPEFVENVKELRDITSKVKK